MKHEEVQELLGAYALHALEPDERAVVEQHLASCPECRAEVRDHEEVAALLGNSGGLAPDGLWDRIASTLEEAPPPMRLALARQRRGRRLATMVVGLAAAAVIALLGVQIVHQGHRIDHLQSAVAADAPSRDLALALLAPGARRVTLTSTDGRVTVTAVVLPNGNGYLSTAHMATLADGQTYQLWGQTDAGLLSLGVLGARPHPVVAFEANSGVVALAITEEHAPGVARSTHSPVVAGRLD